MHEMGLSENFIITLLLSVLIFPATSIAQDQNLFPFLLLNPTLFSYSRRCFTAPDYQYLSASGDAIDYQHRSISGDTPSESQDSETTTVASINYCALQITPDSQNDNFTLFLKSGRVMLRRSFKIWSIKKDTLLSFNSTFIINLFPTRIGPNSTDRAPGEGLTFVIAPDMETPPGSEGGFLGLTNSTHDGSPLNRFIAIEFDTVKEDENDDPNDNHMGLNINSVRSIKTVYLSEHNITIAPVAPTKYMVWVQYSGASMLLDVYLTLEGNPKPKTALLSQKLNLKDYLNQYSYFGFSASTGVTAQLNSVLSWNLTADILPELEVEDLEVEGKSDKRWLVIFGGVCIPAAIICVVGLWTYYSYRKRMIHKDDMDILGALQNLPGMPREFMFKELKKATNDFDEKLKLGQGGFGIVYKGVLPAHENYTELAVKKFSRESLSRKFDFLTELTIINRLRHKHLVRLLGWCHKNGMLLLVYDYMPNGSLDNHLYGGGRDNTILGWSNRYKILNDVASALHYLHIEYEQTIVHRDLKASNIMLDSDFNARLGDFGLARTIEKERNSYAELEGIPGTLSYIAPECFHTGKATRESDVFGFGAVVLEVVCGERPWTKIEGFQCLVDWVWRLYREGRILEAVDQRLGSDYEVEEAKRLLLFGLACSHPIASERPKTQTISQITSGSMPVPSIPMFKPSFFWPSLEPNTDDEDDTPYESPIISSLGV